jgi:hypothetical protein
LLIASVDKAKEMGINWWENDPYLSSKTQLLIEENKQLIEENKQFQHRLNSLEEQLRLFTAINGNHTEQSEENSEDNSPNVAE